MNLTSSKSIYKINNHGLLKSKIKLTLETQLEGWLWAFSQGNAELMLQLRKKFSSLISVRILPEKTGMIYFSKIKSLRHCVYGVDSTPMILISKLKYSASNGILKLPKLLIQPNEPLLWIFTVEKERWKSSKTLLFRIFPSS